jgi:hypothetical protein
VTFIPEICSEREPDSSWEDCTWATGVMLANFMLGEERIPTTRDEYESLRFDATGVREGHGDGSNYGELETGLRRRYHFPVVRRGNGWEAALEAAPVGSAIALQVKYGALVAHLRITGFLGTHSFLWIRDQPDSGLLLDPLAVKGSAPRRATNAEIKAAFIALGWEWIAAHEREAYDDTMFTLSLDRWKVPAGLGIFDAPNGTQVSKFSKPATVTTVGIPNGHTADGIIHGGWRAVLVSTGALDGKLAPKVCYVKMGGTGTSRIATDAAWDATVLKALSDPTFRGEAVIHAEAAELAAATKAGRLAGLTDADKAIETLKGV